MTKKPKVGTAPESPIHALEKFAMRRVERSEINEARYNPRKISTGAKARLSGVLKSVGMVQPIVWNRRTGNLAGGHQRLRVLDAESGGKPYSLTVSEIDVPLAEEKKINVLLNNPAVTGEWDDEKLAALLRDMAEPDATGFDAAEIERLIGDIAGDGPEPQLDRAEELLAKWKVKRGQVWSVGAHRIMCGDSADEKDLRNLTSKNPIMLIVTSPPYNQDVGNFSKSGMHKETKWTDNTNKGGYKDNLPETEYQAQQIAALKVWSGFLSATASIFYNHKNRFRDKRCLSPWRWLDQSGAKVRQEIIWKREGSVTQNARMFMPCDERVFWLYFGADFYFNDSTEIKTWSSVWEINSHKDREASTHGCAFPLEIPRRCIEACSKKSEAVLEPFLGSGTTLVACQQLGRVGFGMELEPKYVAVSLERLSEMGLKPKLATA